jgi:predicted ester cyclase
MAEYLHAFPDYHDATLELLADGDRVVTYNEVTGTHEGLFRGIEPTGEAVRFDSVGIYWLADGKIVRSSGVLQWPTLLRQLGLELTFRS